jgi:hypothetical protein
MKVHRNAFGAAKGGVFVSCESVDTADYDWRTFEVIGREQSLFYGVDCRHSRKCELWEDKEMRVVVARKVK